MQTPWARIAFTVVVGIALVSCGDLVTSPRMRVKPTPATFTSVPLTTTAKVVISQVYGGGGNAGATIKNDFIELYNGGQDTVDLTGASVQYAATTGSTWQITLLAGKVG